MLCGGDFTVVKTGSRGHRPKTQVCRHTGIPTPPSAPSLFSHFLPWDLDKMVQVFASLLHRMLICMTTVLNNISSTQTDIQVSHRYLLISTEVPGSEEHGRASAHSDVRSRHISDTHGGKCVPSSPSLEGTQWKVVSLCNELITATKAHPQTISAHIRSASG